MLNFCIRGDLLVLGGREEEERGYKHQTLPSAAVGVFKPFEQFYHEIYLEKGVMAGRGIKIL